MVKKREREKKKKRNIDRERKRVDTDGMMERIISIHEKIQKCIIPTFLPHLSSCLLVESGFLLPPLSPPTNQNLDSHPSHLSLSLSLSSFPIEFQCIIHLFDVDHSFF